MTDEAAERDPSRSIAYILGRIENAVEVIHKTLSEDRTAAAQYRTEIRKELRDHTERMQKIEEAQALMKSDLGEIKPTVAALEAKKNQAVGVMHFGKWAYTLLTAGIGAAIWSAVQSYLGHPPQH
jgi:hypothetical protein